MNKILNNDRQQVHGRMEHHSEQLKIVDGTMQYPFNISERMCVCGMDFGGVAAQEDLMYGHFYTSLS